MKKIVDSLNRSLADAGINARIGTVAVVLVCCVLAITFAYKNPVILAPAVVLFIIIGEIGKADAPPSTGDIALCMAEFLGNAANTLAGKLSIFEKLFYDTVPIEGGGVRRFPRWQSDLIYQNGIPITRLGLLRASKEMLSGTELKEELLVLQGLLSDDLKRGNIPLAAHPCYSDGTPTLSLIDIEENDQHMIFSFVWVNSKKTSDFVHMYGVPRDGNDTKDQDF